MTVMDVTKDPEARTMRIAARFDAPISRVWQIWSEPRQLERWWGPPEYPATVLEHDLAPGGRVAYSMTGPDGAQHRGWWRVVAVEPPRYLEFEDGFADEAGHPNTDLPTTVVRVTLTEAQAGTAMEIVSQFPSTDAMEQLLAMGTEEGMRAAVGQIDGLLGIGDSSMASSG